MSKEEAIQKKVELLMTEREIQKVIYNYCSLQDKRKLMGFLDIFTEDCRFFFPAGGTDLKGKESVKAYFVNEVWANMEFCLHACYNISIDVDHDLGRAMAEAYFEVRTMYNGEPQDGYGRYLFHFRKEGEKWRVLELICPLTWWNGSLAPEDPTVYERFKYQEVG